jgi:hypothetical protein
VGALVAAGYRVCAINPLHAATYRERQSVTGAKSDASDSCTLADMVRTDGDQLRPIAGDSDQNGLPWFRCRNVQLNVNQIWA